MRLLPQGAERRDEGVFKRRFVNADLIDLQPSVAHSLLQVEFRILRIEREEV